MRITSSVLSLSIFLALTIASRANSDESDESDESGESSTKFFARITSLINRTINNHGHRHDGPSTVIQPYPYSYMGHPYYMESNIVPYLPTDHPSVAYVAPQPSPGAYIFNDALPPNNANPNYPLYPSYTSYPNVPAYNPYQGIPAKTHSSDSKHRNRHSSQEDSEGHNHSRGQHDLRNGLTSMDHSLKLNTDYQETGHYFGPFQGRPLGLDNKPVSSGAPN